MRLTTVPPTPTPIVATKSYYTSTNSRQLQMDFVEGILISNEWASWQAWTSCSVSCAIGVRNRQRHCRNAEPSKCVGPLEQVQFCQTSSSECVGECDADWTSRHGLRCEFYSAALCSADGLNLQTLNLHLAMNISSQAQIDAIKRDMLPLLNGQWVAPSGKSALVCPQCGCTAVWSGFDSKLAIKFTVKLYYHICAHVCPRCHVCVSYASYVC